MLVFLWSFAASATEWQTPPAEILDVLHAKRLPWVWTSPSGEHLLLADPVTYPPLSEYAAGWHELAGIRVKPGLGLRHGWQGATGPRLVVVDGGAEIPLALPDELEVHDVVWTADGQRFALTVEHPDHVGLWVGAVDGALAEVEGVVLNPTLGDAVSWMPDQAHLLVRSVPVDRGPEPAAPAVPVGPKVLEGSGDTARSTYESRNLLVTAHDDALFEHYATSQLLVVDPDGGKPKPVGEPGVFTTAEPSPSGKYLLVERLVGPWSHAVPFWRFAHEIEVWNKRGKLVATVASLPLADEVPIHGVAEGPRGVMWRATEPHSLFWIEALDGGRPTAEVPHRDRLMRLDAPFRRRPRQIWRAKHRLWARGWAEDGTLMVTEWERMRRWDYTWLVDVDRRRARAWFDLSEDDRYHDPGNPLFRPLDNGQWVLRQQGESVYFSGAGATEEGDRPFLDLRHLRSGEVERLFRADPERYERFVAFAGASDELVIQSESPTEVPNYHRVTLGARVEAEEGEATRAHTRQPITAFPDPSPQLRQIEKRIVRYEREDGVPLSFHLYLPPGYEEGGDPLPTVLYAYPLEYNDASTAGQVRGSSNRFEQLRGPSHMFFLLQGYAVLHRTAMPMVGDPETVYDTFVEQLVMDAEAAVHKAVEMGVADPERIGVIGHSHGGLMVAHLLAHTDLFAAGIARSGSYNKTNQPFGFQSERRTLFEARDTYIQVSPTFVADQVNEPVLVIHGDADSNPGTLTFQSEVFFEGVRGSGGTARLVLLPFEDHGYRARESIEHVLWEQLRWFDEHVKRAAE